MVHTPENAASMGREHLNLVTVMFQFDDMTIRAQNPTRDP
jgi:hypothetical protein